MDARDSDEEDREGHEQEGEAARQGATWQWRAGREKEEIEVRRVQRYAPEINKRIRRPLKMSGTSYRVYETHIQVWKSRKYLYRVVDREGRTIWFRLGAERDVTAAIDITTRSSVRR